jgi:DNA-binding LacI/PurR family transcriptional regulator
MGKKASEILIERIEKGIERNKYNVRLPVTFIRRNSTEAPKKGKVQL